MLIKTITKRFPFLNDMGVLEFRNKDLYVLNYEDLKPFMFIKHSPEALNFNLMDCVKHFEVLQSTFDNHNFEFSKSTFTRIDYLEKGEKQTLYSTILSIESIVRKVANKGISAYDYTLIVQETDNFEKLKHRVAVRMINGFEDFFKKGDNIRNIKTLFYKSENHDVLQYLMLFFIFSDKSLTQMFIGDFQSLSKFRKLRTKNEVRRLLLIPFYRIENIKKLLPTSEDLQYLTLLQKTVTHIVEEEHGINPEMMADTYFIDFSA